MAQNDMLKRYLDAGLAFTQMTRGRAEAIVKDLVKAGEVQRDQTQDRVDELIERSRRNTEQLIAIVRREITEQLQQLGLISKADAAKAGQGTGGAAKAGQGTGGAAKAAPASKSGSASKSAPATKAAAGTAKKASTATAPAKKAGTGTAKKATTGTAKKAAGGTAKKAAGGTAKKTTGGKKA